MKLSDMETIFWSIQGSLDSDIDGPINQFKNYVISTNSCVSSDIYNSIVKVFINVIYL